MIIFGEDKNAYLTLFFIRGTIPEVLFFIWHFKILFMLHHEVDVRLCVFLRMWKYGFFVCK